MIIAVDFDGTIVESNFPTIVAPMSGALDALSMLADDGHFIIIWTCRTGQHLLDAINWLLEHNVKFNRVNDHNPENVALYGDAGNKVYAHVYVDDKNLGGFPGWFEAYDMISNMEDEFKSKKV